MNRLPKRNKIKTILSKIKLRTWISIGIIVVLFPILFAAAYGIWGALGGSNATPIAHWTFDEGVDDTCPGGINDACDSTGNGNDLAFGDDTAAPSWQTEDKCISGKCTYFDGDSDYLGSGDQSAFDFGEDEDFSISLWFKANAVADSYYLVSKGALEASDGAENSGYFVRITNSTITLSLRDQTSTARTNIVTGSVINANNWYHLTATFDRDGNGNIYLNGNSIASGSISDRNGDLGNAHPFVVGTYSASTSVREFLGFIDEVKVFDSALTAAQVKAEYAGGAAVLGSKNNDFLNEGLVAYWPMNDDVAGDGQTLIDQSGNGRDLTTVDGTDDEGIDCTVAGKFDGGCQLDTDDDRLTVTTDYGITTQVSISAWYITDTLTLPINHRMIYTSANPASYVSLNVNGSAFPFFSLAINGTQRTLTSSSTSTVGKLTHVVATYDGNNMRIYVDGVLRNTGPSFPGTISGFSGSAAHRVGNYTSDNAAFLGMLDEVRIYNRALSPAEVKLLYNWAPGPVGYWKMDEKVSGNGEIIFDSSGSGNNGTTSDGANDAGMNCNLQGRFGGACEFDGTDDVIDIGDVSQAEVGTGDFTLMSWINHPDPSSASGNAIIGKRPTGGAGTVNGYTLQIHSGSIRLALDNDDGDFLLSTAGTVTANTWHHITVTVDRDSSTGVKFYLDGVLVGTADPTDVENSLDNANSLAIGMNTVGGTGNFIGLIDEAKIYNYVRTPQQILEDMNGDNPTNGSPPSNLLLHWNFDESHGSTAHDLTGNGYDGTLGGNTLPSWVQGKYNGGLFFTAVSGATTGSRVTYSSPTNVALGTTTGDQLTLTMWVNPSSSQTNPSTAFLVRNGNTTDANYAAFLSSLSNGRFTLTFTYHDGTTFRSLATTARHIIADEWNHIGLVMTQGTNVKVYVNGTLRETLAWAGSNSVTPSTSFNIGGHAGANSQSIDGYIDEVKVYRGGLTDEQIKIDYNNGLTINFGSGIDGSEDTVSGAITPPVAYWDFNEKVSGDAQTLLDKSGNGNNLTTVDGANNTGLNCSAPGKYGSSCLFDGADDYAFLANPSFDDFGTGEMSVSAWVKYTTTPSAGYVIVGNKTAGSNNAGFSLEINTTNLAQMRVANGSAQASAISSGVANNDGQWHHIVGVFERGSSDRVLTYVDGRLISTGTPTSSGWNISSSQDMLLGAYGTSAGNGNFNGNIDDVKIYNYALSPSQVAYEFNQGAPIAWFKMDECTGDTLNDAGALPKTDLTLIIGNAGDNTSEGDCESGTGTEAWNNGTTGKYGASMDFDGTDDYAMYAGQIVDSPLEQVSFSAWVNPDTVSGTHTIMEQISGAIQMVRSGSQWRVDVRNASSSTVSAMGGVATAGVWSHVTGVYDGAIVKLYVDGKFVTQSSLTGTLFNASHNFIVGCDGNTSNECGDGTYFDGKLDDIRIYGYALSDEQVKREFNEGKAVKF